MRYTQPTVYVHEAKNPSKKTIMIITLILPVIKIPVYMARSITAPAMKIQRLPNLSARIGSQSSVTHHPMKYAELMNPTFHRGLHNRSNFSPQLCKDYGSSQSMLT